MNFFILGEITLALVLLAFIVNLFASIHWCAIFIPDSLEFQVNRFCVLSCLSVYHSRTKLGLI